MRVPQMRNKSLVVIAGIVIGMSGMAYAESVSVSPTQLSVARGSQHTLLTVRAEGAARSVVQIRAFKWKAGRPPSELQRQDSVVVSPPISRLSPRQELTVRIIRKSKQPVHGRECYRILVDRLPDRVRGKPAVALQIRHSIPLCFEG